MHCSVELSWDICLSTWGSVDGINVSLDKKTEKGNCISLFLVAPNLFPWVSNIIKLVLLLILKWTIFCGFSSFNFMLVKIVRFRPQNSLLSKRSEVFVYNL